MALKLGTSTGSLSPSTSATAGGPNPNLTGLPTIDALIASLTSQITRQGIMATKQLNVQKRGLKQQRKQNAAELAAYQAQLAQSQVQPAPQVSSLSSPEVQMAQRQTSIDASSRMGLRKSILAGAGFQGSAPSRSAILG